MSRRKTVKLDLITILPLIKTVCRSNVVFCEKMGRTSGKWVSDWCRIPPKNLPSPEEAAKMCLLLNTTPEEILTESADIELVNGLIEQQRAEQGIKKDPAQMGEVEMTDAQKEAWELIQKFDDEKLKKFIAAAKAMLGD